MMISRILVVLFLLVTFSSTALTVVDNFRSSSSITKKDKSHNKSDAEFPVKEKENEFESRNEGKGHSPFFLISSLDQIIFNLERTESNAYSVACHSTIVPDRGTPLYLLTRSLLI